MASPQPQANAPLLHRFLGIGLILLAIVAGVLTAVGVVPILPAEESAPTIGYGFAGIVVIMLVMAFLIFKPRVPARGPGQSVDAFWATPEITAKVLPVWFLMEGAGVFGLVGYFMTGEPLAALAAGLGVAAFWMTGPDVFAKP